MKEIILFTSSLLLLNACASPRHSTIAPPLLLHERGVPSYASVRDEEFARILTNIDVMGELCGQSLYVRVLSVLGEEGSAERASCEVSVTIYIVVGEYDMFAPFKVWQLPALDDPVLDRLVEENGIPVIYMTFSSIKGKKTSLRIEPSLERLRIRELESHKQD